MTPIDPVESSNADINFQNEFLKNNNINEYYAYNPYRLDQVYNDPGVKGIPIMFVTTPSLNFSQFNLEADGFLSYIAANEPHLLNFLTTSASESIVGKEVTTPFIPILTNRFSDFNAKDIQSVTKEVGETYYGYKQLLPGILVNSKAGDTTSVTYIDNADLDILKLHKVWVDYTEHVARGTMKPSKLTITNKFIDYTCSIYLFVLDMDGETIQYFCKYTGCSPISVPYGEFSSKVGGNHEIIQYSIEYAYSYKEDMDPAILYDFNAVSRQTSTALSFNEAQSILYGRQSESAEPDVDILVDRDLSNLRTPIVTFGSYPDSNKKRFRLQFT